MIGWIKKMWEIHKRQRDCHHDWYPIGYVDWSCTRCGKLTDGWPDQV